AKLQPNRARSTARQLEWHPRSMHQRSGRAEWIRHHQEGEMRRPNTGTLALAIGLGDIALVPVLFSEQLRDIGSSGLLGSVMFDDRADPRAAALWFATKGLMLVGLGLLARAHEELTGSLPAAPGWVLVALGGLGALIAPVSGFWVYLALGMLWVWDSRR